MRAFDDMDEEEIDLVKNLNGELVEEVEEEKEGEAP
jgi:hypothetical protein